MAQSQCVCSRDRRSQCSMKEWASRDARRASEKLLSGSTAIIAGHHSPVVVREQIRFGGCSLHGDGASRRPVPASADHELCLLRNRDELHARQIRERARAEAHLVVFDLTLESGERSCESPEERVCDGVLVHRVVAPGSYKSCRLHPMCSCRTPTLQRPWTMIRCRRGEETIARRRSHRPPRRKPSDCTR